MKKPFLLTFAFLAFVLWSFSQPKEFNVNVGAKGLFVEHKVAAKENFYSIGREFNVHPKRLAAFNGLDMTKGLSLGQLVNIPLSDTNFVHKKTNGIPVYYQSTAKQTVGAITSISKTSSEDLRRLNNLSTDNISAGTKLVIGYLVSEAPIALNNETAKTKPANGEKKQPVIEQPVKENEPVVSAPVKIDPVKEDPKSIVKEEPKEQEPLKQVVQNSGSGDGYFKASFVEQVKIYPLSKEETVTSGIFKTTSGWNDAKFYALIDGIEPGTIIKVINPNNNKEVYAKVLGQMSGIRQNQGLNLRISNAAASALEIPETDKFIVKVNY
ncbi:MAG: LysM peptidoglycan-binding protein [Chitinophagaceae bacterium]|nr:LysM peptidoglycan-binding protein [Chitinophagaceae bacterium]